MRHLLKTISILVTIFSLIACVEEAAMDDFMELNNELESIRVTAKNFEFESITRSTVKIDDSGVQFFWSANDTVGIFPNTGRQAEFVMGNGAGMQTATFNGGGWTLKHSATYSAYYPYNYYLRDKSKIPVSYEKQEQQGNASTTHLGAYDFMAAGVSTPSDGVVAFDMQHMGALIMFQANLEIATELTSVSVHAQSEAFTMKGTIDLSAVHPNITATSSTSTITIPLNNFGVEANQTSTVYIMIAPANLLNTTLEVIFYDGIGEFMKYEIPGKNFVAGKAYAYQLENGEQLHPIIPDIAVDLGLPSGTFWADRNVGASSPEAYGTYFAWGETEPKENFSWENYKWSTGDLWDLKVTKYCTVSEQGQVDNKLTLELSDDAAYTNMDERWCMPTVEQIKELLDLCTWEWTSVNDVNGSRVTGPNGNSIFLPATGYRQDNNIEVGMAGYYWTSSLSKQTGAEDDSRQAFYLKLSGDSSDPNNFYSHPRYRGKPVRAVMCWRKKGSSED